MTAAGAPFSLITSTIWRSRSRKSETSCAASIRWPNLPAGQLTDGKFHAIRIAVGEKGLQVHARKGYLRLRCRRRLRRARK